jgi:hypothetical protein
MSQQMLKGEIERATIELAKLMRGDWRNEPFSLIERSCSAFADAYVAQLIERNKGFVADDFELLDSTRKNLNDKI